MLVQKKVYKKHNRSSWLIVAIALSGTVPCHAGIFFGNKNSGINVNNSGAMKIATPGLMDISGGNISNQGFGSITGKGIAFNRGTYGFFNSTSDLQALLDTNNNIIQLAKSPSDPLVDGGTMIANPGGLSGVSMQIKPGINIMRGQPLFFGPNDLVLQDNSTLIAVGIQNTLNTNITLNGGVLFLQDDLRLGDDAVILDNGTVAFNNRRLSLGGKASTWTGTILWDSALDLHLNSQITLNGNWMFTGTGQINGNGNVIDIAGGGSITVLPHSTLTLAAVHLKGLASTGILKIAPDSILYLTDTVIEMDNNFDIDSGTVYVQGSSTVITKEYFLTFTSSPAGTNGKVIVDRVALTYDTLSSIDQLNIRPQLILDPDRKHVEIIQEGEIRTIREDTITYHNYRSAPLLLKYAVVAPYRKFQVFPEVSDITNEGPFNYNVILNGNTNFLGFTLTDEQVFMISDNVHVITQDIIFRELSTKHIGFGQNSSLIFGENTRITFGRDETLDYQWTFTGQCMLYGGGKILTMAPGGVIEVRGKGSELLLDGLIIKGLNGNNIRCTEPSSKITMKNVKWVQDGNFTYSTGSIDILDDVSIVGGFDVTDDGFDFFTFSYQSTEPLTILNNSTLSLIRNAIFSYGPVNLDPTLFQFADTSAALLLDQATLGATDLLLSTGQLLVRGRNFLSGNVVFDDSLFIDQPEGATLEQI